MISYFGLRSIDDPNLVSGLIRVTFEDDVPDAIEVWDRAAGAWFDDPTQVKFLVPGEERALPLTDDEAETFLRMLQS